MQVKILQATGLPRHLSNFVFCQYHFWGQDEQVFIAPEVEASNSSSTSRDPQCTVVFDSTKVRAKIRFTSLENYDSHAYMVTKKLKLKVSMKNEWSYEILSCESFVTLFFCFHLIFLSPLWKAFNRGHGANYCSGFSVRI